MEKRRVVITGMGTINPVGHNVAESCRAVRDGVCGIAPITQYDSSAQKVHLAAEVKNWTPPPCWTRRKCAIWAATPSLQWPQPRRPWPTAP